MTYFNRLAKVCQRYASVKRRQETPGAMGAWLKRNRWQRSRVFCLALIAGMAIAFSLHGSQPAYTAERSQASICPVTSTDSVELIAQGAARYHQGQFNQALTCWQAAARVAQQAGDTTRQLISEINQAQAMQALGLHLRACQTLLQSLGAPEQTCQSLTDADMRTIAHPLPQISDPVIRATVQQTGLRSLGDVLRSLGYLELSEQVLTQTMQQQGTAMSAGMKAILLSLGKTEHAFSKRYQELYNRSGNLSDAIVALQKARLANDYYQRIINQSPSDFSAIQAQLNQLNLRLALTPWIANVQAPMAQPEIAPSTFTSLRQPDGDRECTEVDQSAANPTRDPWSTFQQQVATLTQAQPSLTTLIPQLQYQMQQYPTTHTSGLSARLNFAHILSQLYEGQLADVSLGATQSKSLETRETDGFSRAAIAQHLAEVAQIARQQGNVSAEAYALGYLGKLYLLAAKADNTATAQATQLLQAQEVTLKALRLAQTTHLPGLIYQWETQLGDIYRERSRQDAALMESAIGIYGAAIETLKSVRSDLLAVDPDIQFTFRDNVEPTYRQLISLLLQLDVTNQTKAAYLGRALEVMDGLQKAELENFLQCSLQGADGDLPKVKSLIASSNHSMAKQVGVATIYPILLDDRLEVVVKLPHGELHHASTPVKREILAQTIKTLRPLLTHVEPGPIPFTQPAGQLYNWLIQPIAQYLNPATIKTLVFVPDSLLRNIPMAVLYHQPVGSDAGRYLIQDYAIAVSPGLNLPRSHGIDFNSLRVLMAGSSEERVLSVQDKCTKFNALPNVEVELKFIASVLKQEQVSQLFNKVRGQEFTEKNFRARLAAAHYPIVHLATHGTFSSNPQETFILTADGDPIYVNDLQETLQSRLGRSSHGIELLVLSACETAEGDSRAALGIAGVAVRSGASSTLASLWTVDDRSTAQLMQHFYTQLTTNRSHPEKVSKAEALRQAQLALLTDSSHDFQHPTYWAPFILVGNWQ